MTPRLSLSRPKLSLCSPASAWSLCQNLRNTRSNHGPSLPPPHLRCQNHLKMRHSELLFVPFNPGSNFYSLRPGEEGASPQSLARRGKGILGWPSWTSGQCLAQQSRSVRVGSRRTCHSSNQRQNSERYLSSAWGRYSWAEESFRKCRPSTAPCPTWRQAMGASTRWTCHALGSAICPTHHHTESGSDTFQLSPLPIIIRLAKRTLEVTYFLKLCSFTESNLSLKIRRSPLEPIFVSSDIKGMDSNSRCSIIIWKSRKG